MSPKQRMVKAAEFKAKCLSLLDEVARTGETIVVTKRGKPVAEVVPVKKHDPVDLRGSVTYLTDNDEDLFSTGEEWECERPDFNVEPPPERSVPPSP